MKKPDKKYVHQINREFNYETSCALPEEFELDPSHAIAFKRLCRGYVVYTSDPAPFSDIEIARARIAVVKSEYLDKKRDYERAINTALYFSKEMGVLMEKILEIESEFRNK